MQKNSNVQASDFVPYISNLTNMFRKVPRPLAPRLVNPVSGTRISLANARAEVDNASRAGDLSTAGLDAQTGAAIRVGNMANRFRSLSDLNSKEEQINATLENQNKALNANIDAQNTSITNQYRDDLVNADIAQQRQQSENISNAADKYVAQQTAREQMALEKEKAKILSNVYTGGTYDRLMSRLSGSGVDTGQFGYTSPTTSASPAVSSVASNPNNMKALRKYMQRRRTYAAGGTLEEFSGDPTPKAIVSHIPLDTTSINGRAAFADMFNNVVGKGLHPFNSPEGRAALQQAGTFFNPQFASDLGTRITVLQSDPQYAKMTPAQRVEQYYKSATGTSELDQFLKNTSYYGGSPGAFYSNSPYNRGNGGSIHIKPENRGKFNAYKARTGKTTEEALHSKDPHVRKMANFARNAAKWKHAYGGKMIKPFC